jgi:hypothetical protein
MRARFLAASLIAGLGFAAGYFARQPRQLVPPPQPDPPPQAVRGLPNASESLEAITEAARHGSTGGYDVWTHRVGDREIVAVTVDIGSGAYLQVVHLYVGQHGVYTKLLYRLTNTRRVTFSVENEEIVARSWAGRTLFRIPLNTTVMEFQAEEQREPEGQHR